jgi:hypothetical protein
LLRISGFEFRVFRPFCHSSTVSTHLEYGVESPFLKKWNWRKKRTPTDSQPPSKEGRPFFSGTRRLACELNRSVSHS